MSRSKLSKAMARQGGGVKQYVDATDHQDYTEEELMQAIYDNRSMADTDGGTLQAKSNKRNTLMKKAGFDFFDVRELIPNQENNYSIDEGSIESLASLIYESKNTTPLVLRATAEGIQIVDGERRYRAHLLLGKRYGERWYMVPARCFPVGTLSDEDARFIMHAENIGQRNMTNSERARGFAAVADRVIAQRKNDPEMAGRATKEILAEQFGVSERTAVMEVNIGNNLVQEGQDLYDQGGITKVGADALAKLPEGDQQELIKQIKAGQVKKAEVPDVAKGRKRTSVRVPKTTDEHLIDARKSLKKALGMAASVDRVLIAELRNLLDKLDPDKED